MMICAEIIDIPMAEFNKFLSSSAFIRVVLSDSKEETEAPEVHELQAATLHYNSYISN